MKNIFPNKNFTGVMAVLLIVILVCGSFLYFPNFLTSKAATLPNIPSNIDRQTRIAMIVTPAYFATECVNPNIMIGDYKTDTKVSDTKLEMYLDVNDTEFRDLIRRKVRQNLCNNKIVWNKEYVDKFLKMYFPDLYEEIQNTSGIHKSINTNAMDTQTSSSLTIYKSKLITYAKTLLGVTMAEFDTNVRWSCDGNTILYVVPSTYGRVYAPGWKYLGINEHDQYFKNNHSEFFEHVTGEFTFTYYNPFLTRHYYPTIDYVIFANGNLNYNVYGW